MPIRAGRWLAVILLLGLALRVTWTVANAGHDVSFVIAGTGLAPRLHLAANRLSSASWEEMSSMLRQVVTRVACGGR